MGVEAAGGLGVLEAGRCGADVVDLLERHEAEPQGEEGLSDVVAEHDALPAAAGAAGLEVEA